MPDAATSMSGSAETSAGETAQPLPVSTRLGSAVSAKTMANPGYSGIYPLSDGRDAFAARSVLAKVAERTLDVQYYIWHGDLSGTLLFHDLLEAAERGVHVRLLLDDNNTAGLDPTLAALDTHPNVEVRLFNPFRMRRWRYLNYLTDFARLNRRMHNKSFTADGQASIVGGRNIGDEYFDAGGATLFNDLDVLAVGPVVGAVVGDFERYWNCGSSHPAGEVLPSVDAETRAGLAAVAHRVMARPEASRYVEALAQTSFMEDLEDGSLEFVWAEAQLISDDPAKGLGRAPPRSLLLNRLQATLKSATSGLHLVSPYFVPLSRGVASMIELAGQGVDVTVLTNAFEATDVAAVHAGYAKRRKALLAGGVRLFEQKRTASVTGGSKRRVWRGPSAKGPTSIGGSNPGRGLSTSSLHAKTFAIDGKRCFIGSMNLDPRSAQLNTELGFLIESPAIARTIEQAFDDRIPDNAYEVRLAASGRLQWIEAGGGSDGADLRHDTEPGMTPWQRLGLMVLAMLPIEWLL